MHFTSQEGGDTDAMAELNISAFQNLWNNNNPCDPIPEDEIGELKDATLARLAKSPTSGFEPNRHDSLPVEGWEDTSCPTLRNGKPAPPGALCCPGISPGDKPWCSDSGTCCPVGSVGIPGGTFSPGGVGSPVTVGAFCMDTTEVTVEAYDACVVDGACSPADSFGPSGWSLFCNTNNPQDRSQHPINCVELAQAAAYCEAAGGRLPTEAEWEWAARSGDEGRTFPWGEDQACGVHGNTCGPDCAANYQVKAHATWPSYCAAPRCKLTHCPRAARNEGCSGG
jgi:hypothetical protein